MGILKILAITGAGIWSYRALNRLNDKCVRIAVPRLSRLAHEARNNGDIYADTFVVHLPKQIAFSSHPVNVSDLTKSFFNCKVFFYFERPFLKLALRLKEPQLKNSKFLPGEEILFGKVAYRSHDEILLEWQYGQFHGFTWFHVNQNQVLMFGNSIGHSAFGSRRNGINMDYCPLESMKSAVRVLKDNPYEQDIFKRIRNFFSSFSYALVITGHQFYSRLLLSSTLRTLILEGIYRDWSAFDKSRCQTTNHSFKKRMVV